MTKMVNMGWAEEMRRSGELARFHLRGASVFVVDEDFREFLMIYSPSGVVSVRYTVDLANLPTLGMDEVRATIERRTLAARLDGTWLTS